jgi:hypothetical protein
MAQRDLESVSAHLKAAAENVQSPAERSELERLDLLAHNLKLFWESLQNGLSQAGGSDLAYKNTRIAIVEASRDHAVIRAEGKNFRVETKKLPTPFIVAFAEQRFVQDANWKVLLGTFLAMDAKGDRDRARQLWREAAAGGINIGLLLPELEVPLP